MTRRVLLVVVLVGVLSTGAVAVAQGDIQFEDVSEDSVHAENIQWLRYLGITTGCGDGNYCPDDPVTRAEMATFLRRYDKDVIAGRSNLYKQLLVLSDQVSAMGARIQDLERGDTVEPPGPVEKLSISCNANSNGWAFMWEPPAYTGGSDISEYKVEWYDDSGLVDSAELVGTTEFTIPPNNNNLNVLVSAANAAGYGEPSESWISPLPEWC